MINQGEKSKQWQLGGNSPEAYEHYLVPPIFAPWAEDLIERVALGQHARVLDVGCGTGIVARRAAVRLNAQGTIVGFDINEAMLAVARTRSATLQPAITWRKGNAVEMPFADGEFDVVFCQQALQFIPDHLAALQEMYRVLRPKGRLAFSVWRPIAHNPSYIVLADALKRHGANGAAAMIHSIFPEWDRAKIDDLAQAAGFQDVHIALGISSMRYPSAEEFLRQEAASSPLAEPLGALPIDTREALIRDIAGALQAYTDDDGIIFPMETYIIVAHK